MIVPPPPPPSPPPPPPQTAPPKRTPTASVEDPDDEHEQGLSAEDPSTIVIAPHVLLGSSSSRRHLNRRHHQAAVKAAQPAEMPHRRRLPRLRGGFAAEPLHGRQAHQEPSFLVRPLVAAVERMARRALEELNDQIAHPDQYVPGADGHCNHVQHPIPGVLHEHSEVHLAAFELDLFNAAPIGCIVNITFHEIFLARTIIPLVFIVFLKLVPVIGPKLKKKSGSAADSKEAFDGFETAAFFVMFLVYPSCSQYVFAMWQCVEVDDGTSWLRRDFSIDCASPKHIIMSWVAWVMLVVYPLGIPAYFAYTMLWQHGAGLDELQRLETRARAHAMLRKSQKSAVGVQDTAVKKLQLRFRATMAKRKREALAKRKETASRPQRSHPS